MPAKIYHKKCEICNVAFETKSGKALYCSSRVCKKKAYLNKAREKRSLTILYEVQMALIHRKVDFIIGVLALKYNIKVPADMMPKSHKVDIENIGGNLVKIFGRERKQRQKDIEIINKKIEKLEAFPIEKAPKPKVVKAGHENLVEPVKKGITAFIKENTGKYPIFPPQANGILKEVIDKIAKKIEVVNTENIMSYIKNKFPELKSLPNATDF